MYALRAALAELHGVAFEEVVVGGGADGVIDLLSQATLEPGDEIVCGWPSFPSYVLDAAKLGAVSRKVPLRDHVYDLDGDARGDRAAHEARLRLPSEQPDRHRERPRGAARRSSTGSPSTSSRCSTRRTSSTSTIPTTRDGIAELFREGRRVVVLRTFSKIYGLAGLRVGYGVAPADVVAATSKVRRAFDVTATGAGGGAREPRRRGGARAPARAQRSRTRRARRRSLRAHGLEPAGPALGNFLFVDVGDGARAVRPAAARRA